MLSQMQAKIRQLSPVGSPKNQNKLKHMAESIEYASSDCESEPSNFRRSYTSEAELLALYTQQRQPRATSPRGFYHQLAMTQQEQRRFDDSAQRQSQPQLALKTIIGPGMIPPRRPPAKSPQVRPQIADDCSTEEDPAIAALSSPRPEMLPLPPPAADISIEDKREMERDLFVQKLLNGELDPNLDP